MLRRELIVIALAACGDTGAPEAAPPPLAATAAYRIDTPPRSPCARRAKCEVQLVLTALGSARVDRDYAFEFVADPSSDVEVDGRGMFSPSGAKLGIMTILVRSATAGQARVTGTFKLSVCTDGRCERASPAIAFDVPTS